VTYVDSSVIVKRYYEEPGTERVLERLTAAERVFTSRLAYAEVHAALARKRRERAVSEAVYGRAASAFESDWRAYDQIALDAITLGAVARLVRQHPVRGADAVHLAAAVWLREHVGDPLELWASDDRLLDAARRERLIAVNPEV
jgi:predicted nucleic acid-binding protein